MIFLSLNIVDQPKVVRKIEGGAYVHGGIEVSTHFLRQQPALVLNKFIDFLSPRCSVGGFRVLILLAIVSFIEVVTQILAGVQARLDQLSLVLVQPPLLSE